MSGLEKRYVDRVIAQARAAGVDVPADVLNLASHVEHGDGGIFRRWQELHPGVDPDEAAGHRVCCYGVAVYGWERCECWEAVYDKEQADPVLPVPEGSIEVRPSRCSDCAFRKDSPERADPHLEEELIGLAVEGTPFWCHTGMRRPKLYRHPYLGDVPGLPGDWRPPQVAGVPFRRDGSPGMICAGWAQEVKRQERVTAGLEQEQACAG